MEHDRPIFLNNWQPTTPPQDDAFTGAAFNRQGQPQPQTQPQPQQGGAVGNGPTPDTYRRVFNIFAGTRILIEYFPVEEIRNGVKVENISGKIVIQTFSERSQTDDSQLQSPEGPERELVFEIDNNHLSKEQRLAIITRLQSKLRIGMAGQDTSEKVFVRSKQFALDLMAPRYSDDVNSIEGLFLLDQPRPGALFRGGGVDVFSQNFNPAFEKFKLLKNTKDFVEKHNASGRPWNLRMEANFAHYGIWDGQNAPPHIRKSLPHLRDRNLDSLKDKLNNAVAIFYGAYSIEIHKENAPGFKGAKIIRDDDGYYLFFTAGKTKSAGYPPERVVDKNVNSFDNGTDEDSVIRIWLGDHRDTFDSIQGQFLKFLEIFNEDHLSSQLQAHPDKLYAYSRLMASIWHAVSNDAKPSPSRPGHIGMLGIYNADLTGVIWPRINMDGMNFSNCHIEDAFIGAYCDQSKFVNCYVPRNVQMVFAGGKDKPVADNLNIEGGYWGFPRYGKIPFSRTTVEIAGGIQGGSFYPERFWCNCIDMHTFKPSFEKLSERAIFNTVKHGIFADVAVTGTPIAKWITSSSFIPFINFDDAIYEWYFRSKQVSMQEIFRKLQEAAERQKGIEQVFLRAAETEYIPGGTRRKAPMRVGLVAHGNSHTIEYALYSSQAEDDKHSSIFNARWRTSWMRPGFRNAITRRFEQAPKEDTKRNSPLGIYAEMLPELGSSHHVTMAAPDVTDPDWKNQLNTTF